MSHHGIFDQLDAWKSQLEQAQLLALARAGQVQSLI